MPEPEDIREEVRKLSQHVEALISAVDELRQVRKSLINTTAMEEQTVSVVRGLGDRWRDNADAVTRLRETVDNLAVMTNGMKRSFDMLYNELIDIIHCPIPNVERRILRERRSQNDSADAGGQGAQ